MALNMVWLWVAAALSVVTWVIHTLSAGPQIVRPLFASDLRDMPKYVLYFVWHIVTIVLAALAVGFVLAALYDWAWVLAVQATILSALIGLLILGIAMWRRMGLKDMPQWTLFLLVALTGALAIWL